MRRMPLRCLAVSIALVAASGTAYAFHRAGNYHGASCQPATPGIDIATYSNVGAKIQSTTASMICPVNWTQDSGIPWMLNLQRLTVSLFWAGAAVPAFNPGCMLDVRNTAGSDFFVGVDHIDNVGTANPVYVFVFNQNVVAGTILSSTLVCDGIPQTVVIMGYTMDSCFNIPGGAC